MSDTNRLSLDDKIAALKHILGEDGFKRYIDEFLELCRREGSKHSKITLSGISNKEPDNG